MFRMIGCFLALMKSANSYFQKDCSHTLSGQKKSTIDCLNSLPNSLVDYSKYSESAEYEHVGVVTSIHQEYGLIDGFIFFQKNQLSMAEPVEIGSEVNVRASRQRGQTGWKADHVTFSDSVWDKVVNKFETRGCITVLGRDTGLVDGRWEFSVANCQTYRPWKGDIVKVKIEDDGTHERLVAIEPFLVERFEAHIRYSQRNFWYTSSPRIALSQECCVGSYSPSLGDSVSGSSLECDSNVVGWKYRALTVKKTEDQTRDRRLSQSAIDAGKYVFVEGNTSFSCEHLDETTTRTFFIRNGSASILKLLRAELLDNQGSQFEVGCPKLSLEGHRVVNQPLVNQSLNLLPGMTGYVVVSYKSRYFGEDQTVLQLTFPDFHVSRELHGVCYDPVSASHDVVSSPYNRQKYRQVRHNIELEETNGQVLPGVRPTFKSSAKRLPKNLPHCDVPKTLRSVVLSDTRSVPDTYPIIEQELSTSNFVSKFSTLLHLEEIQAEIEIRRFDMHEAVFTRSRGFLALEVPGLADGQISLNIGDKLEVSLTYDMTGSKYQAYIHDMSRDQIYVKFHASLHDSYDEQPCNVVFVASRTPFRRMHQGVRYTSQICWRGLFPHTTSVREPLALSLTDTSISESLYNKQLNPEQCLAVKRVIQAKCRPYPYVIFGPPGTGKTSTVVECILQVSNRAGNRLLVCTPSNSAADVILERLVSAKPWCQGEMIRLVSFGRHIEDLPENLQPHCMDGTDLQMISQHKIIICTCVTAGMFSSLGLSTSHFTHLLMDEAGQASEPEALIPISLLVSNPEAAIVLAGDHMQLGPLIKSRIASASGLSVSLLERLMSFRPYSRNDAFSDHGLYDPNLVTKLLRNYRAHPFILSLYSEIFYDNELKECAGETAYKLQDAPYLIVPNHPVIFYDEKGSELQEGGNPSWFNAVEVVQVIKSLRLVLSDIQPEDIGIISPYRKQVLKIRQMMQCMGISSEVKVGSVEEFQGQERQVIIVSTVRSAANHEDALGNKNINIGFLDNPKRFNVTISRAQALLIVVGNKAVLNLDPHWSQLVQYCIRNGCMVQPDCSV